MFNKIAFTLLIILGLSTAQIALVGGLPRLLTGLNLIIAALVFILALRDFESAAYVALGVGLVEDIYSFSPFGLHIATLLLTLFIINYLYKSFFTNRSLYSFSVLVVLANLAEIFLQIGFFYILHRWQGIGGRIFPENFLIFLGSAIVLNFFLAVIIFYSTTYISQRFRPVFLIRRKS